jgi:hypothetical protein
MLIPLLLVRHTTSPHDAESRLVSSPRTDPAGTPVVYQAHQRQHTSGLLAGYLRLRGFCWLTAARTNLRHQCQTAPEGF